MLIEVRTDGNIKGSEQSSAEVKAVVHAALDRYGDRIRRVDVIFSQLICARVELDQPYAIFSS